jgi:hypothetical protein
VRRRQKRWILLIALALGLIIAAAAGYHWSKIARANRFAAVGDALFAENKFNEAAMQYRVALELHPTSYAALRGAARLTAKIERPEALQLWQQVMTLPQHTTSDREDFADFLIKTNRMKLAQQVIDPLLKASPDTRALLLAARYSKKMGDSVKAIDYARIASKRAPNDDAPRLQLVELLAESTDPGEQVEARKALWELVDKSSAYKKPAVEALAAAPELTADERNRLLHELDALSPKTIKDDLLAADLRIALHPNEAPRVYQEELERWRGGQIHDVIDLARWLNAHQQPELVLSNVSIERALEDNQLLLARLDSLAILQKWNDVDDILNRSDVTLDPSVIESFRARTAQERNATLDAEVHWNHAISLAASDPYKLRFVANFAEQSRAVATALKTYEQLARFPEQTDYAYLGIERVSQKNGDTAMQRNAMAKIAVRASDDPNATDQLAYLNLLLNEDVDKNFATAKKLADQYPNRLAYRVTVALGYLRQHDAASALAQFKAPAPIDWKRTLPAWRAVYAAALLGTDRKEEAQQIIATIPRDRLNPQERELIEP